jgi:hypothetical protein
MIYFELFFTMRKTAATTAISRFHSNLSDHYYIFVKYSQSMVTNSTLVIFALIAAMGLVTVVAVDIILTAQEADSVKPPTQGCRNSVAVNASGARCFHG